MIRQSASTSIRHEWVKETNGQQANTIFGAFYACKQGVIAFFEFKTREYGYLSVGNGRCAPAAGEWANFP